MPGQKLPPGLDGTSSAASTSNASRFVNYILIPAGCIAFLFIFCSVVHTGVTPALTGQHALNFITLPVSEPACRKTFQRYIPSELEQRWVANIEEWQTDYCTALENDLPAFLILAGIVNSIRNGSAEYDAELWPKYLSRFEYELSCKGAEPQITHGWIEPLAASLRHPISICKLPGQSEHVVDRSYLLVESMLDVPAAARPRKNWYFDLGASLWDSGEGGASQKYFVEEYLKYGIEFDGMYLWEPKPGGEVFSKKFDGRMAWKYHYYNTFADPDPNNPFNPLNIMKKVATPDDFIMFKLDIDAPHVEDKFVQLLLNDKEYRSYVDEFYFEHHVNLPEMLFWWKKGILKLNTTLADSYSIFSRLRNEGVRAHGWP